MIASPVGLSVFSIFLLFGLGLGSAGQIDRSALFPRIVLQNCLQHVSSCIYPIAVFWLSHDAM